MPLRGRFAPPLIIAALLALAAASPAGAHDGADAVLARPVAPTADAPLVAVSGTVIDLVVDDRVSNRTLRYVALRLDDGQSIALVGSGLESLPTGARAEAVGRSAGDTLFVTDARLLPGSQAPPAQVKQAPSTTQIEGTLAIVHSDDFVRGRGRYDLVVVEDDGHATPIRVAVIPDSVRRGMRVIASGSKAADGFSLDTSSITILALPAPTFDQVAAAPTTNNVLVMPIKFTDSPATDPFTPTQVDQVMRTNSGSVAAYYNEVSYGQQQLNITVTCLPPMSAACTANTTAGGWLNAKVATPASCNFTAIGQAADAAATAAGYVLGNYKNRYYVMPSNGACGWAGLAYIGYPYQAWSNAVNALWVYGHELGHNFTLWHAGSLYCPGQVIGGSCSVKEYGDPFDVMGNVRTMHFNAMQKSVLNWIPATSVQTQSSGTATYTLSPLESPGQTTYAVKIPASTKRTYWIEFRQPIGFDAALSGLPNLGAQVRVSAPFDYPCSSCGGDDTEFLDMTPATGNNFSDGTLLAGLSYTDSSNGINISVVSASATALAVQVTVPSGTATTTTLASSSNPSIVGTNVTFTATVTGTSPTGSVNFKDGGVSIAACSAAALAGSGNSRTAACTTNTLTAGVHSIVASYSGDAGNASSSSTTLSQTVNKVTSTTGIGSSLTPSTAGTSVTFTATVSGTAPTGTVNFKDGATSITGCSAAALAGSGNIRTATCATASLTVGTHSISAVYSGDATNNTSTSSAFSQVVNKATSNTALSSSANPSAFGASVTFTASITGVGPTGTVNFTDGGSSISGCAAVAVSGSGNTRTAQCPTSSLSVATHSIGAIYSGDATNNTSTSSAFSQVVNKATSTTTLSSSANPSVVGASVTFTASITGVSPTGTVNFTDGGSSLSACSAVAVSGSGNTRTAQCPTSSLSVGTHSISAVYSGDATNNGSTSTAVSQVVNKATSTTTLSSSANPSVVGASVTFTASITGVGPTGTVNFTDGGSSLSGCSAVAVSGSGNTRTAQCNANTLTAATHSIVASYGGDANNTAKISATLSQVVTNSVTRVNVALASAGASASSTFSSAYPASAINNGDRAGLNFGAGGVWKDATASAFPDWVEIDFSGAQTIDNVIVYSVQDNNLNPVDPSDTLTFTQRGLTAFDVQTWNGSAWVTQGSVTGNNLVKRTVPFTATTTTKIRVVINAALGGKSIYSYVTEVEAWTAGGSPPPPSVSAALASSLNPAKVNQSVTFTATVAGSSPTGSVAFTSGGSSIAGCTAVALTGSGNTKTASCTTNFATTATYSIVARYGGDANNATTSSTALSEVVKATK